MTWNAIMESRQLIEAVGSIIAHRSCEDMIGDDIAVWSDFFAAAYAHSFLPLAYDLTRNFKGFSLLPEEMRESVRHRAKELVLWQMVRSEDFLKLLSTFNDINTEFFVVKGILCRQLYPSPNTRVSCDEDLWVSETFWEEFQKKLQAFGMISLPDTKEEDCVQTWQKKDSGLVLEVHRHLFDDTQPYFQRMNGLFADASRRIVSVTVDGVDVPTMCPTDHMLYLVCHGLKHFLHSGFGLRQLCDICLFAQAHEKEIQWNEFFERMALVRGAVFAASLFVAAREYLGFFIGSPDLEKYLSLAAKDTKPLFDDLLQSGIYGGSTMSRRHSSMITLQKVNGGGRHSLWKTLFPAKDYLEKRYPYLKSHPYCLPVAWLQRLGGYGRELLGSSKDNSVRDSLALGKSRSILLEQYGILAEPKS
ncbi:MAG: nucleotidyltransferase family protein [Bacillota bacterium]|nr:nucleotidyltransferase family protein [Bacillota bacterium]